MKRKKGHLASCDHTRCCMCKRTAYHEAGHAVMSWLYDIKVLSIDTRNNLPDNNLAVVWLEWPDDELICAMIDLAGPVAETIVMRRPSIYLAEPEVAKVTAKLGEYETLWLAISVAKQLIHNWKSVKYLAGKILNGRSIIRTKQFMRIMDETNRA